MPKLEAGAESTAPAPSPAPTPSFEDTVLALLGQMTEQVQQLAGGVDAVEHGRRDPVFIDPRVEANSAAADRSRRALEATPDGIPHGMTIPIFPNGEKVPQMVMRQYAPKFGSGELVQLNLDAVPHGRDDGKTRGELMAEKGVPNGYGEIIDRTFLSDTSGIWKYRVKFSPKVMPGSNGGITALYETELLSA
jgi:hypothetical protein